MQLQCRTADGRLQASAQGGQRGLSLLEHLQRRHRLQCLCLQCRLAAGCKPVRVAVTVDKQSIACKQARHCQH